MTTNIVYILCGRGDNPTTKEWLTDNAKIILATPENEIGSNKNVSVARNNVKEHARVNGYKQYYVIDDDVIGFRRPKGNKEKFDPESIDWEDVALGGLSLDAFINLADMSKSKWSKFAVPFVVYYYNLYLFSRII